MNICIDARNLVFESHWAGTSLYTFRLIESLLNIDRTNRYTLYFNFFRGWIERRAPLLRDLDVRMRVLRLPRKYADPLCDRYHFPIDLVTGSFDVIHGPAYELLYHRKGKSIVTIHDLTFHLHPEWLGSTWRDHFIEDVHSAIERADHFITVSNHIKGEMTEHFGIPADRITAIHHGVEDRFSPNDEPGGRRVLMNRFGLMGPYLLSVATREPKKNLSVLLDSYRILRERMPDAPKLILVGKGGWESRPIQHEITSRGIQDRTAVLGYIPNEDLPKLYRHAHLFLFPSLYEGFGMPLLEAMASGCPIVASTAAAIPEVAGDAALLVDPNDPDGLARAMEDLVSDEEKRKELIGKGLERAREFTWEETARKTLEVYTALS